MAALTSRGGGSSRPVDSKDAGATSYATFPEEAVVSTAEYVVYRRLVLVRLLACVR